MLDLIPAALARLPAAVRLRAGRATLLRAEGYTDAEIAGRLGCSRRTLANDRAALRASLVETLRDSGYSEREAALALGVSVAEIRCTAAGSRDDNRIEAA
ncbi:MAG: helix-turn-helix domain-containing protein [Solirubrobacterales bacterium]